MPKRSETNVGTFLVRFPNPLASEAGNLTRTFQDLLVTNTVCHVKRRLVELNEKLTTNVSWTLDTSPEVLYRYDKKLFNESSETTYSIAHVFPYIRCDAYLYFNDSISYSIS